MYKNIKLYNDIESNPGPVYVNELCTVTGSFHQGNEELFGINSGKQCVVNSLVAMIFKKIPLSRRVGYVMDGSVGQ